MSLGCRDLYAADERTATNACASTALGPRMPPPSPTIRYTKRLADKILVAFHQACDQGSHTVAWDLLHVLEFMAMRKSFIPADDRRIRQSLVAAHERLWQLRHSENGDGDRKG
jgi:hypothetical protein